MPPRRTTSPPRTANSARSQSILSFFSPVTPPKSRRTTSFSSSTSSQNRLGGTPSLGNNAPSSSSARSSSVAPQQGTSGLRRTASAPNATAATSRPPARALPASQLAQQTNAPSAQPAPVTSSPVAAVQQSPAREPSSSSSIEILSFKPARQIDTIILTSSPVQSNGFYPHSSPSRDVKPMLSSPSKADIKPDLKGKGKVWYDEDENDQSPVDADVEMRDAPALFEASQQRNDEEDGDESAEVAELLLSSPRKASTSSGAASETNTVVYDSDSAEPPLVGKSPPQMTPEATTPAKIQRRMSPMSVDPAPQLPPTTPSKRRLSAASLDETLDLTPHRSTSSQAEKASTKITSGLRRTPRHSAQPPATPSRSAVEGTPRVTRAMSVASARPSQEARDENRPLSASAVKAKSTLFASTSAALDGTPPGTPPRNPSSMYTREPSGSPLSSLGPSPQKADRMRSMSLSMSPRSLNNRPGFRPHSFVLEVPIRRQANVSPVKKVVDPVKRVIPPHGLPALDSESESSEEEGASGQRDDFEDDQSGGARKIAKAASESEDGSSDGGSDSDDEAFMAAMARVKARKDAGEMLVTEEQSSAAQTSATTPMSAADEPRRSSRTAAGRRDSSSGPQKDVKSKLSSDFGWLDVKSSASSKGKQGFAAIVRERMEKQRSGRADSWLVSKQLLEDDSDLDHGSDTSDSDNERGKLSLDKVESIAQAAAGITDDHDEEYAAYMASPQKREQARAAKERADQIAATLREEAARLAKDKAVTADVDEERVFWRSPQPIRLWMPPSHTQSAWLDRFELAIDAGGKSASDFPSADRLCSKLADYGSQTDRYVASRRLLALLCDPSISDHLTARVLALLDRVLRHSSASGSSVHLTEDVFYQLIATGAKVKMWPGLWSRARDKTPERAGKDDEEAKLSTEQRDRVVRRLLSAIAGLAGLPCCDTKDAQDLVFCLLSLAIDPTSACLQESVDAALSPTLRAAMPDDAASSRLATEICDRFSQHGAQIQLELLRALPQTSPRQRLLRKNLAAAWLVQRKQESPVHVVPFTTATYNELCLALETPDADSAFRIHQDMDDKRLYLSVQILALALTHLSDELYGTEGKQARVNVSSIIAALAEIERKTRTDVRRGNPMRNRAKNAVTRLSHALTYQIRAAGGGENLAVKGDDDDEGSNKIFKPKIGALSGGQTTLNFAAVPKHVPVPTPARAQDQPQLVMDAPAASSSSSAAQVALGEDQEMQGVEFA